MGDYRIGVDIGGTFTDIVLMDETGSVLTKKISSSVENYARAIVEGLDEVFKTYGLTGADIQEILHGTTVASNAILEHKGQDRVDRHQGFPGRPRNQKSPNASTLRFTLGETGTACRKILATGCR